MSSRKRVVVLSLIMCTLIILGFLVIIASIINKPIITDENGFYGPDKGQEILKTHTWIMEKANQTATSNFLISTVSPFNSK